MPRRAPQDHPGPSGSPALPCAVLPAGRSQALAAAAVPSLGPPQAYFTLMGAVDDPDDLIRNRPPGLSPDVSCLVRAPNTTCSLTMWNSDDVHFSLRCAPAFL